MSKLHPSNPSRIKIPSRYAARVARELNKYHESLEYQLCEILAQHNGERGDNEGAVDVLARIIAERNRAMTLLALNQMKNFIP